MSRSLYLKNSLVGRAESVISGIFITEENNEIAWKAVLARYDDEDVLMRYYLNRLMSLNPMKKENSSDLSRLLHATAGVRAPLGTLGRPVEHWDDWFVYLTLQKVDATTYSDWVLSRGSVKVIPTFEELGKFLVRRLRVLDFVNLYSKCPSTNNKK